MAPQKSKRRSRKRRDGSKRPQAVPAQRRERAAERKALAARDERRTPNPVGTFGERPPSPFGGLPISEIAIFAGGVGLIVGLIIGGPAMIVGIIVCTLGVVEVTAREHFSGYRSHAMLLAAIPAVAVETLAVLAWGVPRNRALLLLAVVPVFAVLFWFLRKRFNVARQARVARVPRGRR